MPAHMEPQEAINKGLKKPSECDITIVVFRARMGTLLSEKHLKPDGSRYRSGTEYEYLDASCRQEIRQAGCFGIQNEGPTSPGLRDPERKEKERQWELVEEFFKEFWNPDGSYRSYVKEYGEPSDLKEMLADDLRDIITRYLEAHPRDEAEVPAATPEVPGKSPFPWAESLHSGGGPHFSWPRPGGRRPSFQAKQQRLPFPRGGRRLGLWQVIASSSWTATGPGKECYSRKWGLGLGTLHTGRGGDNPFMAFSSSIGLRPMLEKHGLKPRDLAAELE